jgi:hypothetical protein
VSARWLCVCVDELEAVCLYLRQRARERASEQLARDSLSLGARVRGRVRGRVRVRVRVCVRESETKRELYEMCDEVMMMMIFIFLLAEGSPLTRSQT